MFLKKHGSKKVSDFSILPFFWLFDWLFGMILFSNFTLEPYDNPFRENSKRSRKSEREKRTNTVNSGHLVPWQRKQAGRTNYISPAKIWLKKDGRRSYTKARSTNLKCSNSDIIINQFQKTTYRMWVAILWRLMVSASIPVQLWPQKLKSAGIWNLHIQTQF